eukprot:g22535.t1
MPSKSISFGAPLWKLTQDDTDRLWKGVGGRQPDVLVDAFELTEEETLKDEASPTFGWCSEDEDGVAEIVFTEM